MPFYSTLVSPYYIGYNVSTADQAVSAAVTTSMTGSLISIPLQGLRAGSVFQCIIEAASTAAAGTTNSSFFIKIGTAGTIADANVALFTTLGTPTAATSEFQANILMTVRTIGSSATADAQCMIDNSGASGTGVGFIGSTTNILHGTMANFNSTTAGLFISISTLTGASKTLTIRQVVSQLANPTNS